MQRTVPAVCAIIAASVLRVAGAPFQFHFAYSGASSANEPYEVDGSVHGGPASGYVQTPAGGAPGTSDSQRPTLDELNIDSVFYAGVAAYMPLSDRTRIYTGAEWIDESSSGTLAEPLVSRVAFPAGARFDATVQFDWYRLGVDRRFSFAGDAVRITPKVELALLDFDYELTAADETASRQYAKPAVRVGADLAWRASDVVGLSLEGSASLPYPDTMPMIATAGAKVDVRVVDTPDIAVSLFAGAGVLYVDYEDNQDLPNHVHLEVAPSYETGFRIFW